MKLTLQLIFCHLSRKTHKNNLNLISDLYIQHDTVIIKVSNFKKKLHSIEQNPCYALNLNKDSYHNYSKNPALDAGFIVFMPVSF